MSLGGRESDCRCQMNVSIFDRNRSHVASCHLSAASSTAKTSIPAAATFAAVAITSAALTFNADADPDADAFGNCGYACRALFGVAGVSHIAHRLVRHRQRPPCTSTDWLSHDAAVICIAFLFFFWLLQF